MTFPSLTPPDAQIIIVIATMHRRPALVGFVVLIGFGLVAAATEALQGKREPHYVYKTSQVLLNVSK